MDTAAAKRGKICDSGKNNLPVHLISWNDLPPLISLIALVRTTFLIPNQGEVGEDFCQNIQSCLKTSCFGQEEFFVSKNDGMTNKAEIKLAKFKILTLNKFTQIDFLNVLSSCNIITKFQLVDHVVNLRQTKKQDVLSNHSQQ